MINNSITICFATICKNNEKTIIKTLESLHNNISKCIILDIGSTDTTCSLIHEFFKNKNIQYQIYEKEDKGASNNKRELFSLCYDQTDFILHLEPGEILGSCNLLLNVNLDKKYIAYNANIHEDIPYIKYKTSEFNESVIKTSNKKIISARIVIFNNRYKWKISGNVFHKYIPINVDELDYGTISNDYFYIINEYNENILNTDIIKSNISLLKKDYLDTINIDENGINSLCIFHIAKHYYYLEQWNKSLLHFLKYIKLKDAEKDELFESYIKIVEIMCILDYKIDDLIRYTVCASEIYNERAESYYQLGNIFNENAKYDLGYFCLNKAQSKDLGEIYKKSMKFIDESCYGKNINYQLALSCLHTDRKDEGIALLNDIEFSNNDIEILQKRFNEI